MTLISSICQEDLLGNNWVFFEQEVLRFFSDNIYIVSYPLQSEKEGIVLADMTVWPLVLQVVEMKGFPHWIWNLPSFLPGTAAAET